MRIVTDQLRQSYSNLNKALLGATDEQRSDVLRLALRLFAATDFGVADEEPVLRRPLPLNDTATLDELANSTTIKGYWLQIRLSREEYFEPQFYMFCDKERVPRFEPAILNKRADNELDDDLLGCSYASDWDDMGSGYQSRRLAVGPVPTLSW